MSNLKSRIDKLEAKMQPEAGTQTKVVYADQTTADELEAMRTDKSIGTLIIVEYADSKPISEISHPSAPRFAKRRVGIDMGKL